MSMHFRDLAHQAAADGVISADEILTLRQSGWADGKMTPEEVDALFAVNDVLATASPEWCGFFIEAVSELVINGMEPRGYVTDEQGRWLINQLDRDGRLDSLTELELLVRVIERATNVPEAVKDYVLSQIEQAALTGEGPTRDGGALDKGSISTAEAHLLRRVIFAQAGDRPAAVSEREAEMLFRLKDATLGAPNSAEWKRLFVQGVGNFMMAYSSYQPLSHQRATELEAFINAPTSGIGKFLSSCLSPARLGEGLGYLRQGEQAGPDPFAALEAAEAVTTDEKAWLDARVNADAQLDELEQALLDFLAEE